MPTWITKPEMIVTFVLFGLSVAVSLWAKELRTVFSSRVRGIKSSSLQQYERELVFLEWINGNTYNLLLWTISNFLIVLIYTFRMAAVMALMLVIFSIFYPDKIKVINFVPTFGSILPGILIGKAMYMKDTMRKLYSFENSTAKLRDKIAKLKTELASVQEGK